MHPPIPIMTPLHLITPLLRHAPLSAALDKQVILKLENLQPSGSFKLRGITVSDAQAVDACLGFADDLRMLVEPDCGAALAVTYHQLPVLQGFHRPMIVVCGGIGVDLAKLEAWKAQFER